MPGLIVGLRGATFGRLHISPGAEPVLRGGHAYWPCTCDCGGRCLVRGTKLRLGLIVSCGCWRADPAVRSAARLKTPRWRRWHIARLGGRARAAHLSVSPGRLAQALAPDAPAGGCVPPSNGG